MKSSACPWPQAVAPASTSGTSKSTAVSLQAIRVAGKSDGVQNSEVLISPKRSAGLRGRGRQCWGRGVTGCRATSHCRPAPAPLPRAVPAARTGRGAGTAQGSRSRPPHLPSPGLLPGLNLGSSQHCQQSGQPGAVCEASAGARCRGGPRG